MFPNVGDRPLRILRTASLILPLLTALTWGWITWNEARGEARERAVSNAALLKEYVQRLIQTEITVLTAADAYAAELGDPIDARGSLHEFLVKLESRSNRSAGIAHVTADGRFAATSRNYTPGLDVSDRAYFAAVRNGEQLYIDRIRTRPGNEDTLIVARRRNGEPFDGAFVSSIFISAIHPFLAQIAAESGEVAALINTDGVLLVRSVPGEAYVLPDDSPMRAVLGARAAGVFEVVAQVDGVRRVYAYRRLDELPLYVNFGVSRAGTAMKWVQGFAPKAVFLMALGLLGFAAASQAARRLDSERERMGAVFRQREAEKVADLKDTMLRELNHRVKNNLQSIDALIRLRLRREPNPVLEDSPSGSGRSPRSTTCSTTRPTHSGWTSPSSWRRSAGTGRSFRRNAAWR